MSGASYQLPEKISIAVLDDYQSLSSSYLAPDSLPGNVEVTVFRDTILPGPPPPSSDPTDPDSPPHNDPQSAALIARLAPYSVIITMRERTPLRSHILAQLPHLRVLLTTGVRNRGIDIDFLKSRGVVVAGTEAEGPASGAELPQGMEKWAATAQHTWALILAVVTNIPRDHGILYGSAAPSSSSDSSITPTASASERGAGAAACPPDKWLHALPLNLFIPGMTLGLLGLGKLGSAVARTGLLGFGMRVICWSTNLTQAAADESAAQHGLAPGSFKVVSKEELFSASDVLSVHVVLSDRSKGLVGKAELGRMKRSAVLINTARGPIVDEPALLDTLEHGRIRGAGLDVFDQEPLGMDSPWRKVRWGEQGRSTVVLLPHSGYSYESSIHGMWKQTKENVHRLARGEELSTLL